MVKSTPTDYGELNPAVDPLALVTHNWTIVFKKQIGTLE
jgi:hypothetical protein